MVVEGRKGTVTVVLLSAAAAAADAFRRVGIVGTRLARVGACSARVRRFII